MVRGICPCGLMDRLFRSTRDAVIFSAKSGGAAFLLAMFAVPLAAAPRDKEKERAVQPTFLRHPLAADVDRGGTVVIPVEAIALPGQKIDLDVLNPPLYGEITPLWSDHSNKVALLYRSDPRRKVTGDEFSIRIRVEGRSWSTQKALVRVHDHRADLKAMPECLDFGMLPAGKSKTLTLTLSNTSGNDATGRIVPPVPWSLRGDPSFSIPEGFSREFLITFTPEKPGDFTGAIEFSPDTGSLAKIPVRGGCLPPFVLHEDQFTAKPEKPQIAMILGNPSPDSVRIMVCADPELHAPSFVEVPAGGSSTLTVDTAQVAVPLESSRALHLTLGSGEYCKSVEITVSGRAGMVVAHIPPDKENLRTTLPDPVRLDVRLVNESLSSRDVSWSLQGDGHIVEGADRGTCRLQGGETRDLSLLWLPEKTGFVSPRLVLNSGEVVSWHLDVRSPQAVGDNSPARPVRSTSFRDESAAEASDNLRLASNSERQRMVILHPPFLTGGLYPRFLQLSWTYQGTGKDGFVIEESTIRSRMTDRTGETDEGWCLIRRLPTGGGSSGLWTVRIPVYWPSLREFRIYPGGEGERVLASQSVPISADMVFGPILRVFGIIALILLVVTMLRMHANRRS